MELQQASLTSHSLPKNWKRCTDSPPTLGLNPPELRTGRDRTRNFSIKDPDNHRIEFVQYEPDSMQAQSRGKFLGNIVSHLNRIALPVANRQSRHKFLSRQARSWRARRLR